MKKRFIIFIVVLLFISIFTYLWLKESTYPVLPKSTESKIFVVEKGDSVREIARKLKSENLIRDSLAFFLLVKKMGVEKNIQAGDFRLKPSMSTYEIISELQHGTLDVWITIPEGWRKEEIALTLAKELAIPEKEFLTLSSEGYLFPDTYLVPKGATASGVIKMMNDNFNKKVTEKIGSSITNLNRTLTIASLVEREAKFPEDRPMVASVILNRLSQNMKLDIDATIQYAIGYQASEKNWWKKDLTKEDLEIKSPYNTYINNGLPPAPICNPGLSSIMAVLNPAKTEYLYYVSDKQGHLHFAENLAGHQKNIEKYIKN